MKRLIFAALLAAAAAQGIGTSAGAPADADGLGMVTHYISDVQDGHFEEVIEIDGSIFHTRSTGDYFFAAALTHLGYYSFAHRHTGSRRVQTTTIPLSNAVFDDVRGLLGASPADNARLLSAAAIGGMEQLQMDVERIAWIDGDGALQGAIRRIFPAGVAALVMPILGLLLLLLICWHLPFGRNIRRRFF